MLKNDELPQLGLLIGLGFRVQSNSLLVTLEQVEVKRGWRERWFSWPWHPFQMVKMEQRQVPDTHLYVDQVHRVITAHPAVVEKLGRALDEHFEKKPTG